MADKNNQNEDSAMWFKAKQDDTQEAYETYLSHFPEGIFRESALGALEKVLVANEDECWEMAILEETIESIHNYIHQYPDGRYLEKANQKLNELKIDNAEEENWEKAKSLNSIDSFEKYLTDFPNGKNSNNAKKAIQQLIQQKEENAWKKALQKDNIGAYESFLNEFSQGYYYEKVQKIISARKKIIQLKNAFHEAYADEKNLVFKKIEALIEEYPDDFAVYDFHQEIKKEIESFSRDKKTVQLEERDLITEKPSTTNTAKPWILILIITVAILVLFALIIPL